MPREFQHFVKERKYLKSVSEKTISWYWQSWKSWQKYSGETPNDYVINARDAGLSPIAINCYLRALNAYFRWSGLPTIPKLKEPKTIPPSYQESDIEKILKSREVSRTRLLVLVLLDTGLRINEALELPGENIDMDNLVFRIKGKGDKERLVPFSVELRKHLCRNGKYSGLLFSTRDDHKLGYRNVMRDVKAFLLRCGIVTPPRRLLHSFRHSFAVNYLRRGGSVFHLQRAMGHSTLDMTRRYVNLVTEDLQEMQQRVSILNHHR